MTKTAFRNAYAKGLEKAKTRNSFIEEINDVITIVNSQINDGQDLENKNKHIKLVLLQSREGNNKGNLSIQYQKHPELYNSEYVTNDNIATFDLCVGKIGVRVQSINEPDICFECSNREEINQFFIKLLEAQSTGVAFLNMQHLRDHNLRVNRELVEY